MKIFIWGDADLPEASYKEARYNQHVSSKSIEADSLGLKVGSVEHHEYVFGYFRSLRFEKLNN